MSQTVPILQSLSLHPSVPLFCYSVWSISQSYKDIGTARRTYRFSADTHKHTHRPHKHSKAPSRPGGNLLHRSLFQKKDLIKKKLEKTRGWKVSFVFCLFPSFSGLLFSVPRPLGTHPAVVKETWFLSWEHNTHGAAGAFHRYNRTHAIGWHSLFQPYRPE